MLIAEDLLLLLVKDSCGKRAPGRGTWAVLAAAVLVELASHDRLDVEEDGRYPRLFVVDDAPVSDPVLDDALAIAVKAEGSRIAEVIGLVSLGLWRRLLDGLAERGILAKTTRKRLVLPAVITWRLESPARRAELRAQLGAILTGDMPPDDRGGALISLPHAVDAIGEIVDESDEEAYERAANIAEGNLPAGDVIKAILEAGEHAAHAGTDLGPGPSGG